MNNEPIKIGWYLDTEFAHVVFSQPKPVKAGRSKPISRRAVQACPAVNNIEKNLFEILAPFSIELSIERHGNKFELYFDDVTTRIDEDLFRKHVFFMPQDQWRHPDRPMLQIMVPYVFVTDDDCAICQLPPFLDTTSRMWPGVMVSGRYAFKYWPRSLNWAFEWDDLSLPLRIKRGDPLFYVKIDTPNVEANVSLTLLENPERVIAYKKKIEGVVKYTNGALELINEAKLYRPKSLL